jgi:hypothetical protein
MTSSNSLRAGAISLMSALGVLDLAYGSLYAGGNYENIWYVMGAIYLVLAGVTALEIEPSLFQATVLGYAIFLFFAWLTSGVSRDPVAYSDKAIEVILAINMMQLIRITWPSTSGRVSSVPTPAV